MFSVKQVSTKHDALWPLNLWAMNSICAWAKDKLGIFLILEKQRMPVFQYSLQKTMGFFLLLIISYSFWNSFYLPLSDAKIKIGVSMLNFAKIYFLRYFRHFSAFKEPFLCNSRQFPESFHLLGYVHFINGHYVRIQYLFSEKYLTRPVLSGIGLFWVARLYDQKGNFFW